MLKLPLKRLADLILELQGNVQSEIVIDQVCLDNILDLSPLSSLIFKSVVSGDYFVVLINNLNCKIIGRIIRITPIRSSHKKHVQHTFSSFGIKSINTYSNNNQFRLNFNYEYSLYIFINNSFWKTEMKGEYKDWVMKLLGKREAILLLEKHLTSPFIKNTVMQMYSNQVSLLRSNLLEEFRALIGRFK